MAQIDFFEDRQITDPLKAAAERFNRLLNERLGTALEEKMNAVSAALLCEYTDKRDFDNVRALLTLRPDLINGTDNVGDTALICAIESGSDKIVEFLLTQPGIDINIQGEEGMTAGILACERNYPDLAKLLLKRPELHVAVKDEDGDTMLICAVQNENAELVRIILEREEANVEDKDEDGNNAYMIALALPESSARTEILELIRAHKSYRPVSTTSARAENEDPQFADIKSPVLRELANRFQYPHTIAFLRWADEHGYREIRHATKKIMHDGRPLMTDDLRVFVINSDALYFDTKRGAHNPEALSICKHIGYDPTKDYPLGSEGAAKASEPEAPGVA